MRARFYQVTVHVITQENTQKLWLGNFSLEIRKNFLTRRVVLHQKSLERLWSLIGFSRSA